MWLETKRLVLREFQQEDLPWLASILADPQVMKFSPTGVASSRQAQEKIESFITSYRAYGFGKWAVLLEDRQELIGYCGIAVEQIDDRYEKELGYRLDSRCWGQGFATEAAIAAIQYGLESLKLPYILGVVERENIASVRVLEKIGMRFERTTTFHELEMDVYRVDATNFLLN
ncbi:MAG: GNAT family N-acetyltransferase [Cyanobacteria bacterium P01_A01_bin.17]